MKLDFFSARLVDAGLGQLGTNIFHNYMPANVGTALLLKLPIHGVPIDHYLPGYVCVHLQVISRAPTVSEGEDLIMRAVAALETQQIEDFEPPVHGVRQIKQILSTHYPWNYPRSDSSDTEWSVNFDCRLVIG